MPSLKQIKIHSNHKLVKHSNGQTTKQDLNFNFTNRQIADGCLGLRIDLDGTTVKL
jgi:hypothetical protein